MTDQLALGVDPPAPLAALRDRLGAEWPYITASREKTDAMMERLWRELNQPHLIPPDTTLVVFGSLARGEFTDGSDVDWTLLVDGARRTAGQPGGVGTARRGSLHRVTAP